MKKKNFVIVMFLVIILLIILIFNLFLAKKDEDKHYKIISNVDGYLSYNDVSSSNFKIIGDDYSYGPYLLNITENNYLSVKIVDGETYKGIGYILLPSDSNFSAIWHDDKISFLCVKTSDNWYFFDDLGNLIELNNTILKDIENEEEKNNIINETIENSQIKENNESNNEILDNNQTNENENENISYSNIIFESEKDYNGFNIGITNNQELIIYKANSSENAKKVYAKIETYVDSSKLLDSEYVRTNGPGFYADWNNSNSGNIRIRVDKYINDSDTRYSYIWYEFDGVNVNLLDEQEYIAENGFIYKSENDYNGFNIGITNNQELIIYKANSSENAKKVYAKIETYVDSSKLLDSEYVRTKGPGFYADWNNAESGNIRIRVDKYINDSDTRYSYIWYEFDGVNVNLLDEQEYIAENGFIYDSKKDYNGFNIGITNDQELIIYKANSSENAKKVYAKIETYVDSSKLLDSEYVRTKGPGFYADWNNAESGNIRIRVDKYVNNSNTRYSYIWYEFDGINVNLLDEHEYIAENGFIYESEKDYNGFKIGITNDKELIIYKASSKTNPKKVYAKIKTYVNLSRLLDSEYVKTNGPGFYVDWNNANSGNIRIRIDKYLNNSDTRAGYIWYEFDGVNVNLLDKHEYVD